MYILWILIDNFFFSFLLFVVEGFSGVGLLSRLDCGLYLPVRIRCSCRIRSGAKLWLEHCWTCCGRSSFPCPTCMLDTKEMMTF
ncbi:vicilin-like seed storage protein [Iris pallida]|uniref:Vicilin-like seed storage protein n=1 Tax=Iris pallida TaxID=29817 RepID=A0AAX6I9P3_IRIPA|nr:vicilin-like seed storage protein [Iris pallida]